MRKVYGSKLVKTAMRRELEFVSCSLHIQTEILNSTPLPKMQNSKDPPLVLDQNICVGIC